MKKMFDYILLIVALVIIFVFIIIFVAYFSKKAEIKFLAGEREYYKRSAEIANTKLDDAEKAIKIRDQRIEQLKVRVTGLTAQLKDKKTVTSEKEPFDGIHTNMYRMMDYRKITDKKSDQYALQYDPDIFTQYNGIRTLRVNGTEFYCAALGGAFGYEIGSAWAVQLKNGYKFNIIQGDYKHPVNAENAESDFGKTDTNYLGDECLNVIEFIVDMDGVPYSARQAGTMSAIPAFGGLYSYDGDIADMQYIGKVWNA